MAPAGAEGPGEMAGHIEGPAHGSRAQGQITAIDSLKQTTSECGPGVARSGRASG
jgi:hypothetical protein